METVLPWISNTSNIIVYSLCEDSAGRQKIKTYSLGLIQPSEVLNLTNLLTVSGKPRLSDVIIYA